MGGPTLWCDFSSLHLLSSNIFSVQRISLSSLEATRIEEEVYKSIRYKTYLNPVMYGLSRTTRRKIISFSKSFLTVNLSKHELDFPKVELQTEICFSTLSFVPSNHTWILLLIRIFKITQ